MVGKLGDVEQVAYQLAHHLPGIVLVIIGKGKLFIVVKQLLAHVPFHVGAHHMPLVAHIIFAKALHQVHDKQAGADGKQGF